MELVGYPAKDLHDRAWLSHHFCQFLGCTPWIVQSSWYKDTKTIRGTVRKGEAKRNGELIIVEMPLI